ncbi:hypothetical protein Dimus_035420, partial [Dionaea muscipula]
SEGNACLLNNEGHICCDKTKPCQSIRAGPPCNIFNLVEKERAKDCRQGDEKRPRLEGFLRVLGSVGQ